jgi:hypothetical protein
MRWAILTAVLSGAFLCGTATAGAPTPVRLELQTSDSGAGTFTASGGGLCPGGTTSDALFATGYQSENHINFHVTKTFTCADGSGTFTLHMPAHYFFGAPTDRASWVIVSGTGAYADLKGAGRLTGDISDGLVEDHLVGTVH